MLILAHVENATSLGRIAPPRIPGYDEHEVQYHLLLCEEAGYLECRSREKKVERIVRMTWAGHEALDKLRSAED